MLRNDGRRNHGMMRYVWALVIAWALVRAILLGFAWYGDPDQGRRDLVLRHFTPDDIARGRE